MIMKKTLVILFLAAAAAGSALGQAPASVAGLTFRGINGGTALVDGAIFSTMNTFDLLPNGTYVAQVSILYSFNSEFGQYSDGWGSPGVVAGSYSYVEVSANQATLTLSNSPFPLTFTDSSHGIATFGGGFTTGPFSLNPTGGNPSARALVNISTLLSVQQGKPATIGFVVGGTQLREILVRAVGPSLAQFGINNFAPNPVYLLNGFNVASGNPLALLMPGETVAPIQVGVGWSATPASAADVAGENARAGAFPLLQGSNDKADIFYLAPGPYTITVNPTDPSGVGAELIEVYEVE